MLAVSVLTSGPRIRTFLLSVGLALATISGATVTVPAEALTTLDAASWCCSAATDITPAGFNARTRVHEYGGASWLVASGTCIFSNFADQRLYRQRTGQSDLEPLTPAPLSPKHHFRYSDGVIDREVGVRGDVIVQIVEDAQLIAEIE